MVVASACLRGHDEHSVAWGNTSKIKVFGFCVTENRQEGERSCMTFRAELFSAGVKKKEEPTNNGK